jgi:hypothetical protein
LGQPHATLTVGAARHGLVGAGGVLGLCPRGSHYALAAFILHCKKYMKSYIKRIQICLNSYTV